MLRLLRNRTLAIRTNYVLAKNAATTATQIPTLPTDADVVVIGGGSAGCNTLYQLAKRNVKAVLLERSKLTSGTTWHTAGLTRGLQPSDVDILLLQTTMDVLLNLEKETGLDPGFIKNGGLYIAHSNEREKDYQRVSTLGKIFNIESSIIDSKETQKIFPLLDPSTFQSALYCPGDGVVDPAMLCAALKKSATTNGAQVFEDCPVTYIQTEQTSFGVKKVTGVVTPHGIIRTNCIINCSGAWSRELTHLVDLELPLVPMKHAYIVTNSMPGIRGMPNIRDQDASIYFRIQGDAILLGGYEYNPEILKNVPGDFQFGLYELDWSLFEDHLNGAVKLCPSFGDAGIKTTVCGPESFTPDHKPIMGADPRLNGLFHNCAFNSAGMMLGGGCAEQIALWVIHGRPELPMHAYDIRRFTPQMIKNAKWITEKSHECYAKYYNTVYPLDESLAGRNLVTSPFHDELVAKGAFMESRQGWERPGYFKTEGGTVHTPVYDFYGAYKNDRIKSKYEKHLEEDCTFDFPKSHPLVREESLHCRKKAALFDLSYYCKLYLSGLDAQKAMDWLFTANTNKPAESIIYTCTLNHSGGVEADVTVTPLEDGIFTNSTDVKGRGFYIVAGGASGYQTWAHINTHLQQKNFNVELRDVSDLVGVLSIQGPESKKILEALTNTDVFKDFPLYTAKEVMVKDQLCLALRVSFVGEVGYELHIPKQSCSQVYRDVIEKGQIFGLRNAGFRSLYSLSCEKGYHLWHVDLRANDSPLEANLGFACRKTGNYIGKDAVDDLRKSGVRKHIAYFTLENLDQPLWGLETIWRNGELVGHLRRGDYAFTLERSLGVGYVFHPQGEIVNKDYLLSGKYQLEIMGKKYDCNIHLKSPFDPENKRML